MKNNFAIIRKSVEIGACMREEEILYILYVFRGHVFREESGRITAADDSDRAWAAHYISRHPDEF